MTRERVRTGKPFEDAIPHSSGIVAEGRFLFTSGLTPRDDAGALVGAGDMTAQIAQVFANVEDVLIAAGAGFADVVRFTIFVTDIDAYRAALPQERHFMVGNPAVTLIEISRLADPDMMVEVEVIAMVP